MTYFQYLFISLNLSEVFSKLGGRQGRERYVNYESVMENSWKKNKNED